MSRSAPHPEDPRPGPAPYFGQAGTPLGAYRLIEPIGRGGMGQVWLAERADGRYAGHAALKVLDAAVVGEASIRRLRREGELLGRLHHPHIARLLDAGVSEAGLPYLVLEHVQGRPIDRYCDERRLDVRARVTLFLDVLAAVQHAHAHLVVHRDIKPANVLVSDTGKVKLLDFGIAGLLDVDVNLEPRATTATTLGASKVMTPEYAAPEQLRNEPVTAHSDQYALGVVLYELLTGCHPSGFHDGAPAELVHAVLHGQPVKASAAGGAAAHERAALRHSTPQRLRAQLEGDLDVILGKTLKRAPQERYESVAALAEDLRRFLHHEPIVARADSLGYRVAKFLRRHRWATAGGAAALLAVSLVMGNAVWQAGQAAEEARQAVEVQAFLVDLFEASRRAHSDPTLARLTSTRELLDLAAARVDSAFARSPKAHAEVTRALAEMYHGLGFYGEADAMWLKTSDTLRAHPEMGAHRLVDALLHLVENSGHGGRGEQRVAALDEAQAILERQPEPDPHLQARLDLERAWGTNGRTPEREELALRAEVALRRLGDHRRVLLAVWARVTALAVGGRHEELVKEARAALAEAEARPDDLRIERISVHRVLGYGLDRLERRREAERNQRQTIALAIGTQGYHHPQTAYLRLRLAFILTGLGQTADALEEARQAVATMERTEGADQMVHVTPALIALGHVLAARGEVEEALVHQRRALSMVVAPTREGMMSGQFFRPMVHALLETGALAEAREAMARAEELAGTAPMREQLDVETASNWLAIDLAEGRPEAIQTSLARLEALCGSCRADDVLMGAEAAITVADAQTPAWIERADRLLASVEPDSRSPLDHARLGVLKGRLALQWGQRQEAAQWFREAIRLRQDAQHPDSLALADARAWLVQALPPGRSPESDELLMQIRRAQGAHATIGPHYQRHWNELRRR